MQRDHNELKLLFLAPVDVCAFVFDFQNFEFIGARRCLQQMNLKEQKTNTASKRSSWPQGPFVLDLDELRLDITLTFHFQNEIYRIF